MIRQTLTEKLESLPRATPEAVVALRNLFTPITFKKGTTFPWHEQAAHVIYFMETGLLRRYFYYGKKAYTYCALENGFLIPPVQVSAHDAVVEYVEFLTDAEGWSLNMNRVAEQAKQPPQLYLLLLDIYDQQLQIRKMCDLRLRLGKAAAQYEFLIDRHKNLVDKLEHPVLASLLNVEPKNLYKIKRKHRSAEILRKAQFTKGL